MANTGALSATTILDLREGCDGSLGCDDNRELSAGHADRVLTYHPDICHPRQRRVGVPQVQGDSVT